MPTPLSLASRESAGFVGTQLISSPPKMRSGVHGHRPRAAVPALYRRGAIGTLTRLGFDVAAFLGASVLAYVLGSLLALVSP